MSKQSLQAIGDVIYTDKNGYLQKSVSLETVQDELRPIINEVLEIAQNTFNKNIHSAYVRGSVAKGTFIPKISDLDMVIVTHQDCGNEVEAKYIKSIKILETKYPFIQGVEKIVKTATEFIESKNPVFKYSAVCVLGEDLTSKIAPLKIGRETTVHLSSILRIIEESVPKIESEVEERWVKRWSIWISKSLIRSAHELVAEKNGYFARDIYPCYMGIIQIYPSDEALIRRVATVAVFGTSDKPELLELIQNMKTFLQPKIADFYS